MSELPPRARRIRQLGRISPLGAGTTSACAENTTGTRLQNGGSRNYLRVRGEYLWRAIWWVPPSELPPRARRILVGSVMRWPDPGTTSACAENTPLEGAPYVWGGNYLRVRGEYLLCFSSAFACLELPPRARRILVTSEIVYKPLGTTSACAENTQEALQNDYATRNYLRVRGEYIFHSMRTS